MMSEFLITSGEHIETIHTCVAILVLEYAAELNGRQIRERVSFVYFLTDLPSYLHSFMQSTLKIVIYLSVADVSSLVTVKLPNPAQFPFCLYFSKKVKPGNVLTRNFFYKIPVETSKLARDDICIVTTCPYVFMPDTVFLKTWNVFIGIIIMVPVELKNVEGSLTLVGVTTILRFYR